MGTAIDSIFKLAKEIDKLQEENTRLKEYLAFTRFFSYLRYLAPVVQRSPKQILSSINRLELTEVYDRVCRDSFDDACWTNECELNIRKNDGGQFCNVTDFDEFIIFLQSLK